jgi:predicted enzyme related to lactoylglutathione lyase
MANHHGSFVWYELMTTDTKAADSFYRDVVGWGTQTPGTTLPGVDYKLFTVGSIPVAGLMNMPAAASAEGAPPAWIGYVGVENVDAAAAKVKELGGQVHKGPADIPGVGRFAVVADPQGAVFCLFKGEEMMGAGEPPAAGAPGHVGWHELYAGDHAPAFDFYAEMFGWTKADALDMGPMGTYQLFAHGGVPIGGMMNKPPQVPKPSWTYYFNVDGVQAAVERVKRDGGEVLFGPMQVPGGSWIIQGLDPQKAAFALVSRGE